MGTGTTCTARMHKKMQKEMMETGKDVAAVHGSKDERDGDEGQRPSMRSESHGGEYKG